jgi:hypothetical protein
MCWEALSVRAGWSDSGSSFDLGRDRIPVVTLPWQSLGPDGGSANRTDTALPARRLDASLAQDFACLSIKAGISLAIFGEHSSAWEARIPVLATSVEPCAFAQRRKHGGQLVTSPPFLLRSGRWHSISDFAEQPHDLGQQLLGSPHARIRPFHVSPPIAVMRARETPSCQRGAGGYL